MAYAARQAATVGRAPAPPPSWAPSLPRADGACLGIIEGLGGIKAAGLAMADDGVHIYTGHANGSLRCWDLRTGERVWDRIERAQRGVQDVALDPAGRYVVTGADDGSVRLWSRRDGAAVATLDGHDGTVWCVRVAPTGDYAASAGVDGGVWLWQLNDRGGNADRCLRAHEGGVWSVAIAPDGRSLATGSADHTALLWRVDSGAPTAALRGHEDAVWSVAWSPDGALIATGSADRTARLWSAEDGRLVAQLVGHEHGVSSVAWSPDGRYLASCSSDHTVRLWEVESGRQRACLQAPEDYVWRLAWAPSGGFLLSTHHRDIVRVWDVARALDDDPNRAEAVGALAPLPRALAPLPALLREAVAADLDTPLSTLATLLALTGGAAAPAPLAEHPGMRALVRLGWPARARVAQVLVVRALAALAVADDYRRPTDVTAAAVEAQLARALAGREVPPAAPPVDHAGLRRGLDQVSERVLTLLTSLGPEACARSPSLAVEMLDRVSEITPLGAPERALLGRRLPTEQSGHEQGAALGPVRQGVARHGDMRALLPSGWALPPAVRAYRHARGELPFRGYAGRARPRLRPTVMIVDVSPACIGPLARSVRIAAHLVAHSLLDAGVASFAIAAGGANQVRALQHPRDLFEILAAASAAPVDVDATLAQAQALCAGLANTSASGNASGDTSGDNRPIALLLSHSLFGADCDPQARTRAGDAALRALFVDFPAPREASPAQPLTPPWPPTRPPWHRHCARWERIPARRPEAIGPALARLLV